MVSEKDYVPAGIVEEINEYERSAALRLSASPAKARRLEAEGTEIRNAA